MKDFAPALKHIADIIERGIREHPELSVGMQTEGIEVCIWFWRWVTNRGETGTDFLDGVNVACCKIFCLQRHLCAKISDIILTK